MGKTCELCGERETTLYCSADDAKLCWSCDAAVHSANFLVARHMRSLLCHLCNAVTECRTSGSHPFPLTRSCATCDPAHVKEEADLSHLKEFTVKESIVHDCKDDSKSLRSPFPRSVTSAGLDSCASQESHSDAYSSVEDGKIVKIFDAGGLRAKPKRWVGCRSGTFERNRYIVPDQNKRVLSVTKPKRKLRGSRSPVSVISMDASLSTRTWDDDDIAESCSVKKEVKLLSLLPPRL